jgi:hypothetical protein
MNNNNNKRKSKSDKPLTREEITENEKLRCENELKKLQALVQEEKAQSAS